MVNKVGAKGQVVIETAIRAALGIEPGYLTVQELKGDRVEIHFYPPEHSRSLRGALASKVRRSVPAEDWTIVKEKAWRKVVAGDDQPNEES